MASSTIQTHRRAADRVTPGASSVGHALRLARQKPLGAAATAIIVLLVLTAVFAGAIAPHDPDFIFQGQTLLPAGTIAPDGRPFILGTDEAGRDELARLIYGARISLLVGILSVGVGTLGGTIIGLISGYYGGKLDFIVQRVMDCQQSIPTLILALLLIAVLGRSLENVIFVIGVSQIPGANRVVRSAVLSIRGNTYVEAARVIGCTDLRIIFRYIAVNTMAPVIVVATTSLGGAIIAEAFLSFLGMGTPPPTASWGGMLAAARSYMISNPQLVIAPAVALSLTVLGWNLAGDALRDILDPRLRRA